MSALRRTSIFGAALLAAACAGTTAPRQPSPVGPEGVIVCVRAWTYEPSTGELRIAWQVPPCGGDKVQVTLWELPPGSPLGIWVGVEGIVVRTRKVGDLTTPGG